MTLIQCCDLSLGYEGKCVLSHLELSVQEGDYLAIVGENGAGKSTLLKGILGLIRPTGGHIHFHLPPKEIGYLPQQTPIQRDFPASVMEVVLSGLLATKGFAPFYTRADRETALAKLRLLGAEDLANRCYRELSGGQQQRVLIARALCATTRLLILDEPITGLDPMAIQDFYAMIRRLNREDGVAILMVSHDLRNAVEEANKILHLQKQVLFYGPAHDYMNSQAAGHFFHEKEQGQCIPTAVCRKGGCCHEHTK